MPAYVAVEGKEAADRAAERTLKREVDMEMAVGVQEHREVIGRIGELGGGGVGGRHTKTMTRLRLGHCRLAWDLYKIGKHQYVLYGACQKQKTVRYVLRGEARAQKRERGCIK